LYTNADCPKHSSGKLAVALCMCCLPEYYP
jgi:Predicted membrane-associated, metal-dependent hydrolase